MLAHLSKALQQASIECVHVCESGHKSEAASLTCSLMPALTMAMSSSLRGDCLNSRTYSNLRVKGMVILYRISWGCRSTCLQGGWSTNRGEVRGKSSKQPLFLLVGKVQNSPCWACAPTFGFQSSEPAVRQEVRNLKSCFAISLQI